MKKAAVPVLEEGSLRPARYAYLRFTYLPQAAVLGAIQLSARLVEPDFSWFDDTTLKPSGLLISRCLQALFAGLSILLTYILGRRLFSPAVGLLGGFLLATSSLHLKLSVVFKPDILVAAMALVGVLWGLEAAAQPTLRRYLLAGLGIGLALSSKPTGGTTAIPLIVAAGILVWRDRRHWIGLAAAGATSVAVFVALNPYLRYLAAFERQRQRYRAEAVRSGLAGDPLETAGQILTGISTGAHGLWLGGAAVLGVALLVFRLFRERDADRRVGYLMFASFPAGFTVLYSLATPKVNGNNLLILLPFTALLAALTLVAAWRAAGERLPSLARPRVTAVAAAALVLVAAHRANARVYESVVPRTRDVALELLAREHGDAGGPFWVRWESDGTSPDVPSEPGPPDRDPEELLLWGTPKLAEVPPGRLDRADAEVFLLGRLDGAEAGFYESRLAQVGGSGALTVEPAPFRAWGPALGLAVHPWSALPSESVELAPAVRFRFPRPQQVWQTHAGGRMRSVLEDNNQCARLRLPRRARLVGGHGLHRRRLDRVGLHRYAASFSLTLQTAEMAEPLEIYRQEMRLPEDSWRSFRIPLRRFGRQQVLLCVVTREIGAPDRDTAGLALWDLRVVDAKGRTGKVRFEHRLTSTAGRRELAALELPLRPGRTEPAVMVGRRQLELTPVGTGRHTRWMTDRFVLAPGRGRTLHFDLPRSAELDALTVTIHRWTAPSDRLRPRETPTP